MIDAFEAYQDWVYNYGLEFIGSKDDYKINAMSYWMDRNHDPRLKIDENNLVINRGDCLRLYNGGAEAFRRMVVRMYLLEDPDDVKDDFVTFMRGKFNAH